MFRSRIAEWSYQLGCVSAVVAIIYRLFWFGGLGARLFGAAPRVVPHSFSKRVRASGLSTLATGTLTVIHREDSKAFTSGRG